jgi:hypothetical protein
MKKITIILPIYKLDDEDISMLNNALSSVENFHNDVKITIVCPEKLKSTIDGLNFVPKLEIKTLYNTTHKTDFLNQINMGISDCDTEWFSILEIDDEYKEPWLSSMNEYIEAFKDVDVFLPIVKDVNVEGKFLSLMNESVWAYGFTNKQGFLDNSLLLEYQNYQTSGGLYRTQVIKDNGSFKDNIKLTFSYEFLLRLTHNGVNVMTVPKIGYQHVNLRENSLFWNYKNNEKEKLNEKEVKFWIDIAKKEYFFKNKRDIKYTEV